MRACNWKGKFGLGIRGNILTEKKIHLEIAYEMMWRGPAVLWPSVHGHPSNCYSANVAFWRAKVSISVLQIKSFCFCLSID